MVLWLIVLFVLVVISGAIVTLLDEKRDLDDTYKDNNKTFKSKGY